MTNVTVDFRHYVMPVRPVTFAVRALHVARYGGSGEDERLTPMFLGYSTLVRGYDPNSFEFERVHRHDNRVLRGVRSAVWQPDRRDQRRGAHSAVRARQPASMDYGPIPVELFGFFDAASAWTRFENPTFAGGTRDWVRSAGFGARVNLLGFLIAEFNLARPLDRNGRGWMFVFNLRPGF